MPCPGAHGPRGRCRRAGCRTGGGCGGPWPATRARAGLIVPALARDWERLAMAARTAGRHADEVWRIRGESTPRAISAPEPWQKDDGKACWKSRICDGAPASREHRSRGEEARRRAPRPCGCGSDGGGARVLGGERAERRTLARAGGDEMRGVRAKGRSPTADRAGTAFDPSPRERWAGTPPGAWNAMGRHQEAARRRCGGRRGGAAVPGGRGGATRRRGGGRNWL